MIRAVLFDLFETLVTEYDPEYSGSELEPLRELFGERMDGFEEFWKRTRKDRHTGKCGTFRDVLVSACRELEVLPDPQLIREANARRIGTMANPFRTVDPGVAAMISGLKSAGVVLGLVSNCESEEVLAWPQWKPSGSFQATVLSSKVGLVKPDPKIYLLACRKLSVPPGETLFAGDGMDDEIRGALEAGLQAASCTWFADRWPEPWPRKTAGAPILGSPAELLGMVETANREP